MTTTTTAKQTKQSKAKQTERVVNSNILHATFATSLFNIPLAMQALKKARTTVAAHRTA